MSEAATPTRFPLAIEHQTVFGLPPTEFVGLAAELGCHHIAIGLTGGSYNPHGYEPYSLRNDASLRRRMIAAMHEHDVSISLGEGILVRPGGDIRDEADGLDLMAELGAKRINTTSLDSDLGRSFDEFAKLAEMACERGLQTTIEFAPSLAIADLEIALAAIEHVSRSDFLLLVDTMHLVRAGHSAADLSLLDPALIGYVQLSDNTIRQRSATYRDDATDRMVPGEGELPLREILDVLPVGTTVGLEVPMRARAEAGESTFLRTRRCVEAARRLMS